MNVYQFIHYLKEAQNKTRNGYSIHRDSMPLSGRLEQFTYETPNVVSTGIPKTVSSLVRTPERRFNEVDSVGVRGLSGDGLLSKDNVNPNDVAHDIYISFLPKYTYLTDTPAMNLIHPTSTLPSMSPSVVLTNSGSELCSSNKSLLSMNLESNLGDYQSGLDSGKKDPDINVSICLFRKNQHTVITDIISPTIEKTEEDEEEFTYETPNVVSTGIPQTDHKEHPVVLEYLSYYMELDTPDPHEKKFTFPSFTYHLDDYRIHEEDDEDVDPFKEACIEHLLKLFSMEQKRSRITYKDKSSPVIPRTPTLSTSLERRSGVLTNKHHTKSRTMKPTSVDFGYHGMIRHENTIYAFFDMNAIEQSFRTSPAHYETQPCVWAVVDEIVRKKTIFHIPVATQITELFMKNPMLWNISHGGVSLSFPRAMYSVVPSIVDDRHMTADDIDELYENVDRPDYKTALYSSSPSSSTKKSKIAAPILPFAYSDMFAERYLFTDNPIPSHSHTIPHFKNGLPTYKRFVVFMYNPKFIFSQKFKSHRQWIDEYPQNFVENMDPEDDDAMEENRNIPCICFSQKLKHHKPVEIWGVIHDDLFDEISMK